MTGILASIFTPILLSIGRNRRECDLQWTGDRALRGRSSPACGAGRSRGSPAPYSSRPRSSEPERLLSALLIANNAANYAGSLGVAAILSCLRGLRLVRSWSEHPAGGADVVHLRRDDPQGPLPHRTPIIGCSRFTPPLVWMRSAMTVIGLVPLLGVVAKIVQSLIRTPQGIDPTARARVSRLFRESAESGALTEEQLDLADRVLSLRRLTVAGEMTPWRQVVTAA